MFNSIEVKNISKKYIITHKKNNGDDSLRDDVSFFFKNLIHKDVRYTQEDFWALKDISFEIKKGDRVGIIGRNGSGKSTLLKILSRITQPTTGKAIVKGRVASLLEVGTGFHPELTGRENIFLNGAILGMRKEEIRAKFDSIINFADIERFLDTPAKRYSSGMYVRLAFSVAAHLEPDILIVDEALAVGDGDFQKKCVSKIEAMGNEGRTVLFVSHNIEAVKKLCTSAMLLNKGELIDYDDVDRVVDKYMEETTKIVSTPLIERTDRQGNNLLRLINVEYEDFDGNKIAIAKTGKPIKIRFILEATKSFCLTDAMFCISIINQMGERISCLYDEISDENIQIGYGKLYTAEITIDYFTLIGGTYYLNFYCTVNNNLVDWVKDASVIHVDEKYIKKYKIPILLNKHGYFDIKHDFKIIY